MANFELKVQQDRTIITNIGDHSRELLSFPLGFIIQLSVHHQNSNLNYSKPDIFFYAIDAIFFNTPTMLRFLFDILSDEGIQVHDDEDGRFSSPNRLQLFQDNASGPQSEPIYTLRHLAERIHNYAWSMRNNVNRRFANSLPIAMDLTISHQQFQSDPLNETLILGGHESLPVTLSSTMAPAVRSMEEKTIQASCTEDCAICLEGLDVEQLTCRTTCAHIFHKKCIAAWLEKCQSCPLCRAVLSIHGYDF